ncbi:MAG: TetR/AcrR family transcriptional regulator [Halieaceae bacterium]|nr:TetR/AcrR family transcriptional regulator [Halieaceae bacterium]
MSTSEQSSAAKKSVRRRNPEKTRQVILETASALLAKSGPDGVSVSEVANLAGINRGTAYHHFQTREELTNATMEWVSERLCDELFSDPDTDNFDVRHSSTDIADRMAAFAMSNPEFGTAWLRRMRFKEDQSKDRFWKAFVSHMEKFAESDIAEKNIDVEVHSFIMLVSTFLWPLWCNAQNLSPRKRKELQVRFRNEVLRMEMYGIIDERKIVEKRKQLQK